MYQKRLSALQKLMMERQLPILALNAGVDLKYFSGLEFHLSERPAILLIPQDGKPVFIFPEFEQEKAKNSLVEMDLFPYPEDNNLWGNIFHQASVKLELDSKKIGVAPESMRFLEIELLQKAVGHLNFISACEILQTLKIQKDKDEISAIRKSVSIAEKALLALIPKIEVGVSEKYLANQLVINLLSEGSESDLAFNPIIASGPNSANPHAVPSDRLLQPGDALIIDWGARWNGYVSDLTRSFLIGEENLEMKQIYSIVLEANQAARKSVKAGISAREVDLAARDIISSKGFGDAFLHRTGHGIGLLPHEDPYISQTESLQLADGMTFTIEPGIYLPGKGGIRIEDNVLVSGGIGETLSTFPRELKNI